MQPSSSYPGSPSPNKKTPNLRRPLALLAVVLVVGLVVLFVGVFQMLRGASSAPRQASGPYATATTSDSTTATDTASDTPAPGATPPPTSSAGNPGTHTGAVRVTQNQDERQACLDNTAPYTVKLFNGGNVTATWHVNIPEFVGQAPGGPTVLSQPLLTPLSTTPYWANVNPQDGTLAAGQTVSFVVTPIWSMPCDGTSYHASVQLRFPSGTTQADIPLTYAGTGPVANSNVVLVSGTLNVTEACPASGVAPNPFTFAIKNIGNGIAYQSSIDTTKDLVGPNYWATAQIVRDPSDEPVASWLYPDETLTVTIFPNAGVLCNGTVYHVYVHITDTQGKSTMMTFTDVFQ